MNFPWARLAFSTIVTNLSFLFLFFVWQTIEKIIKLNRKVLISFVFYMEIRVNSDFEFRLSVWGGNYLCCLINFTIQFMNKALSCRKYIILSSNPEFFLEIHWRILFKYFFNWNNFASVKILKNIKTVSKVESY